MVSNPSENNSYFTPVLPWQVASWTHLTARYERLPHGLLFAGMQGIGKRSFVWRFVAWTLCDNRQQNGQSACGQCQSCQWLASGTHPDLKVLPAASLPLETPKLDEKERAASNKQSKKNGSSAKDKTLKVVSSKSGKEETEKTSIKVDDIRALQPFISQGSTGRRICVIDNADTMTIAAANALLKTLEEPRSGVHLFLITDTPTKLLPTIKSRVQQISLNRIDSVKTKAYLTNTIKQYQLIEFDNNDSVLGIHISQALNLANGAPLAALDMLTSEWYSHREAWLKTWLALRVGKRSSTTASDYWQKTLSFKDFIKLSEVMLMDLSRTCLGLPALQIDLNLKSYSSITELPLESIQQVMDLIEDIKLAIKQNVQEKLGYDRLLAALETL